MVNSVLPQTQAWPFLVGRGRYEGYQTLLAPSFLVEHDMHESLSEATPSVPPGVLGRAEVSCPGVGSLALTYTTDGIATGSDSTNRVGEWTDEHGRPLEMLYGVVAQAPLSDTLTISDLRRAREEALEAYRSFLAREDDYTVRISQPYSLPNKHLAAPIATSSRRAEAAASDRIRARMTDTAQISGRRRRPGLTVERTERWHRMAAPAPLRPPPVGTRRTERGCATAVVGPSLRLRLPWLSSQPESGCSAGALRHQTSRSSVPVPCLRTATRATPQRR